MVGGGKSDGGTGSRILGTILTYLAEKKTDVFVVATANSIEALPPEFTRRGRLDEIFFVGLPTTAERRAIWQIHLKLVEQTIPDSDLDVLVKASEGYSGAEIEAVVQDALFDIYNGRDKPEATLAALRSALEHTVPLSRARMADLRELQEWAKANAKSASTADDADTGSNDGMHRIGFGDAKPQGITY